MCMKDGLRGILFESQMLVSPLDIPWSQRNLNRKCLDYITAPTSSHLNNITFLLQEKKVGIPFRKGYHCYKLHAHSKVRYNRRGGHPGKRVTNPNETEVQCVTTLDKIWTDSIKHIHIFHYML